jgi:hypothetical protein
MPHVALCISITPSERLEAVRMVRDTFHHDNHAVHDEEMAYGADAALTKHLAFLLQQQSQQRASLAVTTTATTTQSSNDNNALATTGSTLSGAGTTSDEMLHLELSATCEALESLFRASSTAVGVSFKRLGWLLLRQLSSILKDEVVRRQRIATAQALPIETAVTQVVESTNDGDVLLRRLTKLLGHFARVGEATHPMAHYPGLLGNLVQLITLYPYDCTPWEARLSALWTIANLACNPENMQMMACTPHLLSALVKIASRSLHPTDSLETTLEVLRSRSIAARAILNLSWSPENKVLLAEHTALVSLLTELLVVRSIGSRGTDAANRSSFWHQSTTIHEILDTTRSHVAGALRNLAAAPRRVKIGLCSYQNGRLLDVLTDAALNDHHARVKDRAFATIHNLAVQDTAATMLNHPALVLAIKDVLLSTADEDGVHEQHQDGSPHDHAAATLLVLERSIQPSMDSYENLLELLESLHPNGSTLQTPTRTSSNNEGVVKTEAV